MANLPTFSFSPFSSTALIYGLLRCNTRDLFSIDFRTLGSQFAANPHPSRCQARLQANYQISACFPLVSAEVARVPNGHVCPRAVRESRSFGLNFAPARARFVVACRVVWLYAVVFALIRRPARGPKLPRGKTTLLVDTLVRWSLLLLVPLKVCISWW